MKLLNRDAIKYVAIILMLIDHVIKLFMENGTLIYNLLHGLSHFTFVTMCFFLVEGYQYTKSKTGYIKRIFLFGLISQIPYAMTFSLGIIPFNIFITLGMCFLIIWSLDSKISLFLKSLVIGVCFVVCIFSDWTIYAPLFTIAFYWARDSKRKLTLVYIMACFLFGGTNISGYLVKGDYLTACSEFILATSGIICSGICILMLYNGKRMNRGKKFNKWFFYFFYPTHLLILGMFRILFL